MFEIIKIPEAIATFGLVFVSPAVDLKLLLKISPFLYLFFLSLAQYSVHKDVFINTTIYYKAIRSDIFLKLLSKAL